MIHIDGNLVNLSDAAYSDIVMAYLRQIKFDYTNAVCRGNINKLIELEDHVLSGNFLEALLFKLVIHLFTIPEKEFAFLDLKFLKILI